MAARVRGRRRHLSPLDGLAPMQRSDLVLGVCPTAFESLAQRRAAWQACRPHLLERCRPLTRPDAWWTLEPGVPERLRSRPSIDGRDLLSVLEARPGGPWQAALADLRAAEDVRVAWLALSGHTGPELAWLAATADPTSMSPIARDAARWLDLIAAESPGRDPSR